MSKKHYGKCALCGKETELTFEHIPPRMALNNEPKKPIAGEEAFLHMVSDKNPWDIEGIKYDNQQRGMGDYSLCMECNNNTGAWYANEYVRISYGMHYLMAQDKPIKNKDTENIASSILTMEIENIEFYPLQFFKQIISMFCSINKEQNIDELRSFVLNKESNSFNKNKYRVYMYLFSGGLIKRLPFMVIGSLTSTKTKMAYLSEITTYPLGFVLYIDPPEHNELQALDITDFCEYPYNQKAIGQMVIPIHECNTTFPVDFRSKQDVECCRRENEEYRKEHDLE